MNSKMHSAAAALAVLLAGAAGLTACARTETPVAVVQGDDDGFNGTLVDPPLRPAHVVLMDTHGARFDLGRPAPGKVTALFFGFTNCDDVCPTTMADLAAARRSLAPAVAQKVSVVFVTVDPQRDTPPALEQWLGRFDQDFIGLRGPTNLVHQAERSLYLPESDGKSSSTADRTSGHDESAKDGVDYEVDHSGSVYVFGPGDKMVLHSGGTTPQQYAEDFTHLLQP